MLTSISPEDGVPGTEVGRARVVPATSNHACLRYLRLKASTVRTFSLKAIAGRLFIPVHDHEGNCLATIEARPHQIQTRAPHGVPPDCSTATQEFAPVYNSHRVDWWCTNLVVVHNLAACWYLWDHGYPVVALLGKSCSVEQARLIADILAPTGKAWIVTNAEPQCKAFADYAMSRISKQCAVQRAEFPEHGPVGAGERTLERILW